MQTESYVILVPDKEYDVTFPPSDLRSLIHQLILLTSCCSYISSTVCSFTYTEHRIIHIPAKYVPPIIVVIGCLIGYCLTLQVQYYCYVHDELKTNKHPNNT